MNLKQKIKLSIIVGGGVATLFNSWWCLFISSYSCVNLVLWWFICFIAYVATIMSIVTE